SFRHDHILLAVKGPALARYDASYTGNSIADTIENLPSQASKSLNEPQVKTLVGIATVMSRGVKRLWSRGRELNSRPADYESAALPLSYLGLVPKTTLASAENCCQFYRKA